jgi:hypothetical protein
MRMPLRDNAAALEGTLYFDSQTEIKLASQIDPKTGTAGSGTYAYTSGIMLLIILQELFLVRQVLLQQMQVGRHHL